ncbi:MAG TPA: hypothetical protein VE521_05925 [Nitrososphaera sp.]|nr:hypothetical protein [Nitrososphaera sp.]
MFGSIDKGSGGDSASDTTSNNNTIDYNIVTISTTTRTNDSSYAPSDNMTETIPMITVLDVINSSTYIVSRDLDDDESMGRGMSYTIFAKVLTGIFPSDFLPLSVMM